MVIPLSFCRVCLFWSFETKKAQVDWTRALAKRTCKLSYIKALIQGRDRDTGGITLRILIGISAGANDIELLKSYIFANRSFVFHKKPP